VNNARGRPFDRADRDPEFAGHKTMPGVPKALEDEVMSLPLRLRARLAEQLIASLDQGPADADPEASWTVEAQRRAEEMTQGKVEGIPAEEALAKARTALR
jgi:putative addiction module component (TIGR02574 family)